MLSRLARTRVLAPRALTRRPSRRAAASGSAEATEHHAEEPEAVWAAAAAAAAAAADAPGAALEPGLYVVATPIGNVEDLSVRALRVLAGASAVLAEDTRHTGRLLQRLGLGRRAPLLSYHAHNERERTEDALRRLRAGDAVALVSDAGTPGVSDPGQALVAAAAKEGVPVVPVPGASAALAALVASGLSMRSFTFVGFLERKGNARAEQVDAVANSAATTVLYEAPPRLVRTLGDLAAACGPGRECCVAREVTKRHEEFYRGSLADAEAEFAGRDAIKGELTVVVAGADAGAASGPPSDEAVSARLGELISGGMSPSMAAKTVVSEHGGAARKKDVYELALSIAGKK